MFNRLQSEISEYNNDKNNSDRNMNHNDIKHYLFIILSSIINNSNILLLHKLYFIGWLVFDLKNITLFIYIV